MSFDSHKGAGLFSREESLYPAQSAYRSILTTNPESTPIAQQNKLLATLLQGPRGTLVASLSQGKAKDLKSAFGLLGSEGRADLRAKTGTGLDHWSELAKETEPEFFNRGLLALGRKAEASGSVELAVGVYGELLGNKSVTGEIKGEAQERMDLLGGGGSLGGKIEKYTEGAVAGVLDLSLLVGIGVGGIGFRVGRMWGANFLGGPGKLGWNQVLAVNALGMAVELPAFTTAAKLTRMGLGHEEEWSGKAFGEEMLGMGLLLGPVRLLQGGMKGIHGLRYGLNGAKAKVYQQVGMLSGIGVGHGLQQLVGYREFQGAGDFVLETLFTWGHFNAAGYVAHRVMPKSIRRFEERLERRTQELLQDSGRKLRDFQDPLGERAAELLNQGVREYSLPGGGKFKNVVLMAAGDGSGRRASAQVRGERVREPAERRRAFDSHTRLARGTAEKPWKVRDGWELREIIKGSAAGFREKIGNGRVYFQIRDSTHWRSDNIREALNQLPYFGEILRGRGVTVLLEGSSAKINFTKVGTNGGRGAFIVRESGMIQGIGSSGAKLSTPVPESGPVIKGGVSATLNGSNGDRISPIELDLRDVARRMDRISEPPPPPEPILAPGVDPVRSRIFPSKELIPHVVPDVGHLAQLLTLIPEQIRAEKYPAIVVHGQKVSVSELNRATRGIGTQIPGNALLEVWAPEVSRTFRGYAEHGDLVWREGSQAYWAALRHEGNLGQRTAANPLELYLQVLTLNQLPGRVPGARLEINYRGSSLNSGLPEFTGSALNSFRVLGSQLKVVRDGGEALVFRFDRTQNIWNQIKAPPPPQVGNSGTPVAPPPPFGRGFSSVASIQGLKGQLQRAVDPNEPRAGIEVFMEGKTPLPPLDISKITNRLSILPEGRSFILHDRPAKTTHEFARENGQLRYSKKGGWKVPDHALRLRVEGLMDLLQQLTHLEGYPPPAPRILRVEVKGPWEVGHGDTLVESLNHRPELQYSQVQLVERPTTGLESPSTPLLWVTRDHRTGNWHRKIATPPLGN